MAKSQLAVSVPPGIRENLNEAHRLINDMGIELHHLGLHGLSKEINRVASTVENAHTRLVDIYHENEGSFEFR